jgi:transcriptional regulator with XRE-family HTH domain
MTLGQRMRARREVLGLTLAQVAQSAEVSRAFVHQVEVGKSQPSVEVLRRIASRLQIGLDVLLEGRDRDAAQRLELELARLALAKGQAEQAIEQTLALRETKSWPLAVDAGLCAAEALVALDRFAEADEILVQVEASARAHDDSDRLHHIDALRQGRPHRLDAVEHERVMERAMQSGDTESALEHARAARILAGAAAGSTSTRRRVRQLPSIARERSR